MSDNEYSLVSFDISGVQAASLGTTDLVNLAYKAPSYVTVKGFHVVTSLSQNAGTGVAVRLLNYGTAGTANVGTVSSIVGGTATAARLTANVPASGTISDPILEEGEWLAISFDAQGAGWQPAEYMRVMIDVQYGLGADI